MATVNHVRDHLLTPLELRVDALERARRRTDSALEEASSLKLSQRQAEQLHESLFTSLKLDLGKQIPQIEHQVHALQVRHLTHISPWLHLP